MDTNKRNSMFKYMIIAHIAAMVLYYPATGLAYRHNNILYDILCAAVTVWEIYLCRKDERHEVFWLIYMGILVLGIVSLHINHFYPKHIAGNWEYVVLFLGAPVYMAFGMIERRLISAFLLIEAAAVILLGYLLFITVRRLKNKRSVKP